MKYFLIAFTALLFAAEPEPQKKISREYVLEMRALDAEFQLTVEKLNEKRQEFQRVKIAACKSVGLAEDCIITGDVAKPAPQKPQPKQ